MRFGRRSIVKLVVLAWVLLLGVETGLAQLEPPRGPYSLEIAALTIRSFGVPRDTIDVAVTARDDVGIGWIDVDCAGDRRLIPAQGRGVFTALIRCALDGTSTREVRAAVFSPDGLRSGDPVVSRLVLHDHPDDGRKGARKRKRLGDVGYPGRIGTFDSYAERLVPVVLDGTPWWKKWLDNDARQPFDFASQCSPSVDHVAPDGLALRCWLNLHPQVRHNIVWREYRSLVTHLQRPGMPRGIVDKLMPYDSWTEEMKIRLDVSVYWAYTYLNGGLDFFSGEFIPDVPPNQVQPRDCQSPVTVIAHDDAWKLYLGTIAHSLALELGNFVPWSVVGYTEADLQLLFHSDLQIEGKDLHFSPGRAFGYIPALVTPAPPTTTFEFLVNNDMIRPTSFSTAGLFIEWGRYGHLYHWQPIQGLCSVAMPGWTIYQEIVYGHRAVTPVAGLLQGTTYTEIVPPYLTWGPAGFVPACHGMAALFQHVLRAVNIPVEGSHGVYIGSEYFRGHLGQTGHSTPFFWTLGQTLSHGDDVYRGGNDSTPAFPGQSLFLPLETYEDWFYGAGKLAGTGWPNVGRQAGIEVPLEALSNDLVQRFCIDKASGASHADGTVAAYFRIDGSNIVYYDVAALEALDLWDKLESKAAVLGFC